MIRKGLIALASLGLVVGSSAAVAQSGMVRAASPVDESEGALSSAGWIIALAVVAGAIVVIVADENDDEPTSP